MCQESATQEHALASLGHYLLSWKERITSSPAATAELSAEQLQSLNGFLDFFGQALASDGDSTGLERFRTHADCLDRAALSARGSQILRQFIEANSEPLKVLKSDNFWQSLATQE